MTYHRRRLYWGRSLPCDFRFQFSLEHLPSHFESWGPDRRQEVIAAVAVKNKVGLLRRHFAFLRKRQKSRRGASIVALDAQLAVRHPLNRVDPSLHATVFYHKVKRNRDLHWPGVLCPSRNHCTQH